MRKVLFSILFLYSKFSFAQVIAAFTASDTVCVNSPVNIQNISQGATTNYWSFCTANINQPPIGTNLGNIGGALSLPVYIDYVFTGGNYYGFVTNNFPGALLRLDFGNSLLNIPAITNLGNMGGAISNNTEGVQIANDNGNWYVLIVGGEAASGSLPSLTTVSLGASITNNTPTATNWGNIGNLGYPHDLYVFDDNGHWYGLTANFSNNTITLFDLTTDLSNTPSAVNLGNIGNLNGPTGLQAINDNGNWRVFVTNALNSSLSRLDFGSSLLNAPTGVNLGNPNNAFNSCRDIYILKYCGENEAFVVNALGGNDVVKLDFGSSLINTPTAVSLGNQGNMAFPHCISKLFRVGADVFSLIANVNNNSITLLQFPGCTNASIPNSVAQNPPPVSYNAAGTYNINLTIDDGLPTQTSYCKQVVVQNCPTNNIINDYTEVLGYDICKNELKVADATKYNPGDTVLIIQMKGAVIDSSNSAAFGTISNYNNTGNYEMNIVKQKNGNSLSLLNILQRQYDIPNGKVQLVRVPYYKNIVISNTLTCLPWDGSKGGILVLNVESTTTLNANIDVSGRGFHGGTSPNPNTTTLYCNYNDYYYSKGTSAAADKGESITTIGDQIAWGKGSPANGGGGGNGHNSGGGGGSNGGAGGFGGYQLDACGGSSTDNRGIGGKPLIYTTAANKIFMGGGGGSGQTDNMGGSPMNGGNGGGIIILRSPIINSAGYQIISKGGDAPQCSLSPIDLCHDGNGGGGAGGTILLENASIISNMQVDIRGGKGGDLPVYFLPNATEIGPGAGGGAGICWLNYGSLPANIVVNKSGGINGVIIPNGNDPYGTTPGQDGLNLFNLKIPVDTILFKPNIDSVRIADSIYSCSSVDFKGLGYINTSSINKWNWNFGDGGTSSSQNISHIYTTPGTYNVKLIVTDINGCKDSISKPVTVTNINITKSPDTSLCGSSPVQLFAAGGATYSWLPVTGLSNPNISNPIATPIATTKYYVTVANGSGCSKMDSVQITVNSLPVVTKSNDTIVCKNSSVQLLAGGGTTYKWSPATGLSNPNIANPIATSLVTTKYYVTVVNAGGCSKKDSVTISVNTLPAITKSNDTAVCINSKVQLLATGGTTYSWSPITGLSNPNISNPIATPLITTKYYVTVTNATGCSKKDSITITVNNLPAITKSADANICLNSQAQLLASGGTMYSWSPAATLNNPNISNPVAKPLVTTKYYVTVTNASGCTKTDSIQVTVNSLPVILKSNDTLVCQGSPVPLFASGGSSYSWTPGSSLNNPGIADPIATPTVLTTYIVKVTNVAGCTKTDSIKVNIKPVPIITKSNDTAICNSTSIRLFVAGGSSYLWSPSSTLDDPTSATPLASPLSSIIYHVRITDAQSCMYNDSVKISMKSPPVFSVSPSTSVCVKTPRQLTASGGSSYVWSPATFLNNPGISNPVATPDATVTYSVTIRENTCNKSTTLFTTLTIIPLPNVQATSSNDITCNTPSSHLAATGGQNYIWSPPANLDDANISNPVATPAATIIYTVTGKDINGCSNSDTVSVKVAFNIKTLYGLPNSFTPNGDGINDCFGVRYWGQVDELDFNIYNRFGERVFHTNNSSVCWDGTYKGKPQNVNIFVYTIKAKTACGVIERKGTVALLK